MTLTREVDLDVTAVRCLSLRGFLADTKTNHLLHSGNNKVRHLLSWDKHARKLTKFSTADVIGLRLPFTAFLFSYIGAVYLLSRFLFRL